MNTPPENDTTSAERQSGIWNTWTRGEALGLFFMVLTGNFFFQYIVFKAVGGLSWPVIGGGVLGVFFPLLGILKIRHLEFQRDFFLTQPSARVMVTAALMAVCALVPTSLLAELSLRLSPADPEVVAFMQERLPTSPAGYLLAAIAIVLVAPLAEEIIFRGLLHRLAAGLWGPIAATAVSSLVFSILHGEAWILFGLIGIGVVLGFIFESTGSVTACWVTHGVHNAISLYLMIRQGVGPLEPSHLTPSDWTLGLVSVVGLVFLGRYLLSLKAGQETEPEGL